MCILETEGEEQILTVYLCLPFRILCLPAGLLKEVSVSQTGAISCKGRQILYLCVRMETCSDAVWWYYKHMVKHRYTPRLWKLLSCCFLRDWEVRHTRRHAVVLVLFQKYLLLAAVGAVGLTFCSFKTAVFLWS